MAIFTRRTLTRTSARRSSAASVGGWWLVLRSLREGRKCGNEHPKRYAGRAHLIASLSESHRNELGPFRDPTPALCSRRSTSASQPYASGGVLMFDAVEVARLGGQQHADRIARVA